jgi:protein-disulfide isomerase
VSHLHEAEHKGYQRQRELLEVYDRARASDRKPVSRRGSIALTVVAIIIIGIAVTAGVGAVSGSPGRSLSLQIKKEVSTLLNGIPQEGDTLGQASAPITLQIFGDPESEDVRTFVVWILPDIIRDWVRTNNLKIQYRSFMNAPSHDSKVFLRQQVAALAAEAQNRLWDFLDVFCHEQGKEGTPYVSEKYLENIAQVSGLNLSQWVNDRENNQLAKQVVKDDHVARTIGFYNAPAFLIGRTGGPLTPWLGYRLYEQRGPSGIRRPSHPLSFITSQTLKKAIEHLP